MWTLQGMIVAMLVLGCCVYAAWTLMPSAARRALSGALLKLPLPAALAQRLTKTATAASGCGCDGCDRAESPTATSAPKTITFHPRPRR